MFFANKFLLSKTSQLTQRQMAVWSELRISINYAGVYGLYQNGNSVPFTGYDNVIKKFSENKQFNIPKWYVASYFRKQTFCFSSFLNSASDFINISFRFHSPTVLPKLRQILKNDGWMTSESEIMFKLRIPHNTTGEALWKLMYRFNEGLNRVLTEPVVLTGYPTYLDAQGKLHYSTIMPILPILPSEKKRKDLNLVAKVDLSLIKAFVEDLPLEEPSGDESIDFAASAESFSSASDEKITGDNAAPQGLLSVTNLDKKVKSPLQTSIQNPSAAPTDSFGMPAQSGGHADRLTFRGNLKVDLNVPKSPSSTVKNISVLLIINVEQQLRTVFKSLSDNGLRVKIGETKVRGKVYPRFMSSDQFVLHAMAWICTIKQQHGMAGKNLVRDVFHQIRPLVQIDAKHCFSVQNFALQTLQKFRFIKCISHSYSNFEGNVFSKKYAITDLDLQKLLC